MIIQGNSFRLAMADNSVHVAASSFPYWGLRDYLLKPLVFGGRSDCLHEWVTKTHNPNPHGDNGVSNSGLDGGKTTQAQTRIGEIESAFCIHCGAWRGSFGLEPTMDLHIKHAVMVCREIKRVLRPDGIFWLNYGDSYATGKNGRSAADGKALGNDDRTFRDKPFSTANEVRAKNLCMIPQKVAIALQADGWIIRSAPPWVKRNPMPESVQDRPGTGHEYVYMLVKSDRYFWDMTSVRRGKLDREGVRRYNISNHQMEATNEDMFQVQTREAGKLLFEELNGKERSSLMVQDVRVGERKEVGENREGSDAQARVGLEIQGQREKQGIPKGLQQVRQDERNTQEVGGKSSGSGVFEEIQKVTKEEGCTTEALRKRKGESINGQVSTNGQGKREFDARNSQTTVKDKEYIERFDRATMERDTRETGGQVRDMRRSGETNEGSHYPIEQGGTTYSQQYSGALPELQLQKEQQVESGRALRTSDFFFDSLDSYIAHLQDIRDNGGLMLEADGSPAAFVVNPRGYKFAHYATWPVALVAPMIRAATSDKGVCPKCGKQWVRKIEKIKGTPDSYNGSSFTNGKTHDARVSLAPVGQKDRTLATATTGWQPSCSCNAGDPIPAIILDPFAGSGATGQAANELGRRFIGVDLNPSYLALNALPRSEGKTSQAALEMLPMFAL